MAVFSSWQHLHRSLDIMGFLFRATPHYFLSYLLGQRHRYLGRVSQARTVKAPDLDILWYHIDSRPGDKEDKAKGWKQSQKHIENIFVVHETSFSPVLQPDRCLTVGI